MKKIFSIMMALAVLAACNMDLYRTDTMTSAQLKDNPAAAKYTTDGNYSLFKDIMTINGAQYSGDSYIRHYFQMSEFRGDNCCLSGTTTDPLNEALRYTDNATQTNLSRLWFQAYRIIYGANSNIESIPEGASVDSDFMKGENYFLRAICHLHLVTLYAKPISCGLDNPGVVLRTSTDCSITTRATVGQVYAQIESDLKEAIRLMSNGGSPRGDKSFVSKEAAQGLLTRVYLYTGKNDECIALASEMLGSDPASHLDENLADMYKNARTSKETLWCVAVEPKDLVDKQSSIASMFYKANGVGWGEIYYSDPLLELYERYPQDLRLTSFCELNGAVGDGSKMVYWPIPSGSNDFYVNAIVLTGVSEVAGEYRFTYDGQTYTTTTETVNTYPVRYITYKGTKTKVYVRDATVSSGVRESHPMYFMKKFSGQDGEPMVCSPIMIRYAEVILNRAEAYAKKGNDTNALADVNVIRTRAGLTGDAQMTLDNYQARGYADVLDVVLDERRLELCFEGHRAIDQYRNGKALDRRFSGVNPWEVIEYTDNKIPYYIPMDEVTVSGIPQNIK